MAPGCRWYTGRVIRKATRSALKILAAPFVALAVASSPLLFSTRGDRQVFTPLPALEAISTWLRGLVDGSSFSYRVGITEWSVFETLPRFFLTSLLYILVPGALGAALGTGLGIVARKRHASWVLSVLNTLYAVPDFILALILQLAVISVLDLLGVKLARLSYDPRGGLFLLLPFLLMSMYPFAYCFRTASRKAQDTEKADFITFARAKGLCERTIRRRHIAAGVIPAIEAELPAILALMQANLFICEFVFSLPGVTRLLFTTAFTGRRIGWMDNYQYGVAAWVLIAVLLIYALSWVAFRLALRGTRKVLTGE